MSTVSDMPIVRLYQLSVSVSAGEVVITEDSFDAEARGMIYKTVQTKERVQGRLKLCVKAKVGKVQERPTCSTNPSGLGFLVVYDDASKRKDFLNRIFEAVRAKLRDQREAIDLALDALDVYGDS